MTYGHPNRKGSWYRAPRIGAGRFSWRWRILSRAQRQALVGGAIMISVCLVVMLPPAGDLVYPAGSASEETSHG